MTQLTLEQLQAMELQVQQGYAELEHPRLVEADALLEGLLAHADVERLAALCNELPEGSRRQAIANVVGAMTAARGMLAHEIPRVAATLPASPPPPPPPPPEEA